MGKILLLPSVNVPLNLEDAIFTLERILDDTNIKVLALQLESSKQEYLDYLFEKQEKADEKEIGWFYPIVNHGVTNSLPSFALGEKNFSSVHEAMGCYVTLSELANEYGLTAYICSLENARWIKNNLVIMDRKNRFLYKLSSWRRLWPYRS